MGRRDAHISPAHAAWTAAKARASQPPGIRSQQPQTSIKRHAQDRSGQAHEEHEQHGIPLFDLPTELLHSIFDCLDKASICAARMTCKTLAKVGVEYILDSIHVVYKRDNLAELLEIAKKPAMAKCTHSFWFQADRFGPALTFSEWDKERDELKPWNEYNIYHELPVDQEYESSAGRRALDSARKRFEKRKKGKHSKAAIADAYEQYKTTIADQKSIVDERFDYQCFSELFAACPKLTDVAVSIGHGTSGYIDRGRKAFKNIMMHPYGDIDYRDQGVHQFWTAVEALHHANRQPQRLFLGDVSYRVFRHTWNNAPTKPLMENLMQNLRELRIGISIYEPLPPDNDAMALRIESDVYYRKGLLAKWLASAQHLRVLKVRMWGAWEGVFGRVGGKLSKLRKVKLRSYFSDGFNDGMDFADEGTVINGERDAFENQLLRGGELDDDWLERDGMFPEDLDDYEPPSRVKESDAGHTTDDSWRPTRLIWVGDDSGLPGPDSNILSGSLVPVGNEDIRDNTHIPPCFQPERLQSLAKDLGDKWLFDSKHSAHREVHQSVVIFSEIARLSGCEAEYWTWHKLITTLLKKDVASNDDISDRTLIYFCWTTEPDMGVTQIVYRLLQELGNLAANAKRVRCFPNIRDLQESERKLGDIKALDHIANASVSPEYKFRPQTCTKTLECTLKEPFVMKRTHSSTSTHVKLEPKQDIYTCLPCRASHDPCAANGERAALTTNYNKKSLAELKVACEQRGVDTSDVANPRAKAEYIGLLRDNSMATTLPPVSGKDASDARKHSPRWFHQQNIDSLINFGEFRVILATLPSADGLHGRKGHVFEAFHTKPRKDMTNPIVSAMSRVPDELLDLEHCGAKTYRDLEQYSLWVFEQLRKYDALPANDNRHAPTTQDDSFREIDDKENVSPDHPGEKQKRSLNGESTQPRKSRKVDHGEVVLIHDCSSARGESMFESLEVGVRLDIGISSAADGHRFFVNEITRSWYGDLISYKSAEPRTRICCALAKAGWRVCAPPKCPVAVHTGDAVPFTAFVDSYTNFTMVQFLGWNRFLSPTVMLEGDVVCVGPSDSHVPLPVETAA
ncbi:uncharacterized protein MYCFIDRAFT_199095 [Pseudocercospora fijiensis CIRAD86]|uniref:F-box domain-containing protein n=1 Tax=Pseudocercospora fijiensis (strain CIRAD86) TaxID=383855 RepID=M2YNK7_PSEFD|nr:uncharacterized protein MYCFIDRAFT_199095 [Pseudocercospora fijiensis CIRAD86]EME79285.1 hypothetical protein MYCFIDRAFT_199095 [Pseudocercospora fijiensis CIRAD86]